MKISILFLILLEKNILEKKIPLILEKPAANARYPGTKGSTQGDTKEMSPARRASGKAVMRNPPKS